MIKALSALLLFSLATEATLADKDEEEPLKPGRWVQTASFGWGLDEDGNYSDEWTSEDEYICISDEQASDLVQFFQEKIGDKCSGPTRKMGNGKLEMSKTCNESSSSSKMGASAIVGYSHKQFDMAIKLITIPNNPSDMVHIKLSARYEGACDSSEETANSY